MQSPPLLNRSLAVGQILVTTHCERRFQERCRPALTLAAAAREMRRLIAEHGLIVTEPPAWLARRQAQESDAYLLIGTDLVLPLRRAATGADRLVALTCLTRTSISDAAREFRNRRAQQARARRRARRRGGRRG